MDLKSVGWEDMDWIDLAQMDISDGCCECEMCGIS